MAADKKAPEAAPPIAFRGRFILSAGISGAEVPNVEEVLGKAREAAGAPVQLLRAGNVIGRRHLDLAAMNAVAAFDGGYNLSRKLEVEVLLYASGQRQIRKAIELLGVRPGDSEVAVVAIADSAEAAASAVEAAAGAVGGRLDGRVLEARGRAELLRLMKLYGFSRREVSAVGRPLRDALIDLIAERMALMAAYA